MRASVVWLDAVRAGDAARAGGKGANLGELLGRGFPVPPGFVVCAAAYTRFVEALDLGRELRQLREGAPGELARHCSTIRGRFPESDLPSELAAAILEAHERLVGGRGAQVLCAVRSSATAEDLGAASFAGQHGTYYYVDAAHVLQRVRQCWASLWTPEAASYRTTHGIEHAAVSMAVVVQEMIAADVAGVCFTANPVTGAQAELIIESSWGMGAAIVDGRVTPDRYVVERDGLRLREQRIADKRLMVASQLEAGREARLEEVPQALRRRETLSPDEARLVAEWSLRSEAHFGKPQDVEWAIRDGSFYLLQSRPITAMGREEVGRGIAGKHVLFKPLVENFTDPLTPITADMMTCVRGPGFSLVRGWIYVDMTLMRRFVPFEVSEEELAERLYSFSGEAPAFRLSMLKLAALLPVGLFLYLVAAVTLARTRRLPDDALEGFRTLCRAVEADPDLGPEDALLRLWVLPRLLDPVANMVLFVNVASIRFLPWMGVLRRLVRRWAPDLRPDAEILLGSGSEGVLSADMGRDIWALSLEARRSARVREILLGHASDQALAALRREPAASDFLGRLDAFLAVNGHRAVKEFELRSPRWHEDPAAVLGMIRNYLLIESEPAAPEKKVAEARAELVRELRARLQGLPLEQACGLRFGLIRFAAERVRYFLKLRENSRFYHVMVPGVLRRKILRIEADLLREGKLKCRDDIFFLRFAEVAALQAGRLGWLDVEDRIRERRIDHVRLCKMGPPKTIGMELRTPPAPPGSEGEGVLLRGHSASPGRFEGTARVILDPSLDVELKPGEVLVAPYTDPAWTPLFLTAGAAVVEVGSYLSHAGTVAREFGMPCVVDVADATQRIRSGDRVAVDGDRGEVRLVSGAAGA